MTDDKDIRADHPELDEDQRDDPTLTRRITREDLIDPEGKTAVASTPEQASISGGVFQQMWRRIQEERKRPKRVEVNTRGQNNMDRSKAFLVLATAVVLVGFVFLALFSTSGASKRAQGRRAKPSLGRPEPTVQQAGATGSAVPLLSADQNGADPNGDQLSPDDILATSRRTQTPPPKQEQPDMSGVNYFFRSATIIFPERREVQLSPNTSPGKWRHLKGLVGVIGMRLYRTRQLHQISQRNLAD